MPAAASPTADSPGYVPESDPEEEPEADDDEDPEEDPTDYPADREDNDDEEEEPSRDDADDEDEDEDEDEEEKEEHPAPADSVLPVHRMTARISIRDEPSISLPPREEIPSPLLPTSPPASVLPALPLPTSSPPLQLLSSDRRADRPEITLPPLKRLGIDLGPRYEVGESLVAAAARPIGGHRADYGFVDVVDAEISRRRAEEVGNGIRDAWEQDTQDIYGVIEDTQSRQTQIYQRVETLVDDNQYHYETARLLDQEALVSREAWGHSMEVSYMARSEIMALRSIVMCQQTMISQLQAADRRSQTVTLKMLQADRMRQVTTLQGQVTALQGLQGPSGGPAQPVAPEEAASTVVGFVFSFLASRNRKMAPKRTTRARQAPETTTTTTSVTDAQLQAMIDQGVTAALAARDVNRAGDDSHTSGMGVRRTERVARECTYQDFIKCQPLYFKGTEGVV
ncbi:hypothetical protein Tco_1117868 [Tanacetum coccineum]